MTYEAPKLRLKFRDALPTEELPPESTANPASPSSSRRPQAWWQALAGPEFLAHIKELPIPKLIELAAEISGAVALTAGQLNAHKGDADWQRRANLALGYMSQKKRLVGGEMAMRSNLSSSARRIELRVTVENALDVEDLPTAIRAIMVFLCEKDKPQP